MFVLCKITNLIVYPERMKSLFHTLVNMQSVSHSVALSLKIFVVVFVWLYLDRNILHDFKTVAFQAYALGRIVCHESHLVDAKISKHLCATAIISLVDATIKFVTSFIS